MTETAPFKPTRGRYVGFVKLCRGVTASAVNLLIVFLFAKGYASIKDLRTAEFLGSFGNFPLSILVKSILLLWYIFLSQFSLWWFVWLPFYFLLFPVCWIIAKLVKLAGEPLYNRLKQLQSLGEAGTTSTPPRPKRKLGVRKIWIALFLLWLLVLRGLKFPWVPWLPSVLLLPIWVKALILASRIATNPSTFSGRLISLADRFINNTVSTLVDPKKEKKVEAKTVNNVIFGLIHLVIERYSGEKLLSRLHREAILTFSFTLLLSVSISAVFWAMVGSAISVTSPDYLNAYDFFYSRTPAEMILWAFGCMFTAIGFPGAHAPVAIKALHAAILATGIFQFTFLLACFSIMASADLARIVESTKSSVETVSSKLDATKDLQRVVLEKKKPLKVKPVDR